MIKYPEIEVRITRSGMPFAILRAIEYELGLAKKLPGEIEQFLDEATSGDYNHLLQTCNDWVKVTWLSTPTSKSS